MAEKGKQEMSLRVSEIRDETPDTKMFRLALGDHPPLQFKPGQFVILKTELWNPSKNRNMRVNRAFSIASSPMEKSFIDLAIKRYPGGRMTPWLHDKVRVGDRVRVTGPQGKFILDGEDAGKFFFIAGGVGIAPLRSMIRYLIDIKSPSKIRLFYSARTPLDFAFKAEFDQQAGNHPDMQCFYTVTRPGKEPWTGMTGRFGEDYFKSRIDTDAKGVFICGPPSMVKDGMNSLRKIGIPEGSLHSEMW
ncbi:MAG TPA: FAD-binding oxidoreductase [Nitrospiria bacterium]|nr:FAD-binding oxidoreductase [Nitrospiria bacterium]